MPNVVVVGAQWGDEGKGKITDILSRHARAVVRSQGGANAGHTIIFDGVEYRLHLIPSGIFYPNATCYIASGVIFDLQAFAEEAKELKQKGIALENRILISSRAHVVLPHHKYIDVMQEKLKKAQGVGTTGKGIGPCFGDKAYRIGLRLADIIDSSTIEKRLQTTWEFLIQFFPFLESFKQEWFSNCKKLVDASQMLRPFIRDDFETLLHQAVEKGSVVFEGAQGTMLDTAFGSYPYVTSSSTTSAGIINGAGVPPRSAGHVLGVMKAYTTRVGSGCLPTTMSDDEQKLFDHHAVREVGTTTGRKRRMGWFDGVIGRYSAMINGIDSFAITKLDILDNLPSIKVATAYEVQGKIIHQPPVRAEDWEHIKPIYEELPGWKSPTSECRSFAELPQNAKKYIQWIEKWCKASASIISVGPERGQTIIRNALL